MRRGRAEDAVVKTCRFLPAGRQLYGRRRELWGNLRGLPNIPTVRGPSGDPAVDPAASRRLRREFSASARVDRGAWPGRNFRLSGSAARRPPACPAAATPMNPGAEGRFQPSGRWLPGSPLGCRPPRHERCNRTPAFENNSRAALPCVDSGGRGRSTAGGVQGRFPERCVADRPARRRRGWKHSAARNGRRKRTRVRVACGGAIRPHGVGTLSSHGHFGRSVGLQSSLCQVVFQPPGDTIGRGGRPSRGSGLPAAALTCPAVGFVRMPEDSGTTAVATRPGSPVVTRAASIPDHLAGSSGGGMRRTRSAPRTRLRAA